MVLKYLNLGMAKVTAKPSGNVFMIQRHLTHIICICLFNKDANMKTLYFISLSIHIIIILTIIIHYNYLYEVIVNIS